MRGIPSGEALLPYKWLGQGTDPLVLIPGLGGKGTSWQPFLSEASARFRTLTFDPPGSGAAPGLRGPVTIRQLALATLALLDRVGVQRAAVVGRSMGGMIAQELALLAPDRVSRLVLVSTTAQTDPHLAEVFELWAHMADVGVSAEVRHRTTMLWCLGARALADRHRARAYLRGKTTTDRPADYAIQARACARHDALERLAGLRVPTLVVAGTDDRLTPAGQAEKLVRAIPRARLLYIADAGHFPYVEAPQEFQRGVLGFLHEESNRPSPELEEDPSCPNGSMLS
jgi:pimeloyl-ACP methyl ester carboxylesterase